MTEGVGTADGLDRAPRQAARHARFPALDAMRGGAAMVVMLYHIGIASGHPQLAPFGFLAVDLFFMMSGFVIANEGMKARGRLNKVAISKYLDCGNTQMGPSADTYEVYLVIGTLLRPVASNKTVVETALQASAKPIQFSQAPSRCSTKGELESRVASMAAIPIVVLLLSPEGIRAPLIAAAAIVALAILGAIGAQLGGASLWKGAIRVAIGGGLAMATTTLIGKLLGVAGL